MLTSSRRPRIHDFVASAGAGLSHKPGHQPGLNLQVLSVATPYESSRHLKGVCDESDLLDIAPVPQLAAVNPSTTLRPVRVALLNQGLISSDRPN